MGHPGKHIATVLDQPVVPRAFNQCLSRGAGGSNWGVQRKREAVKPHLATFEAALAPERKWLSEEATRLEAEQAALDAFAVEVGKLKRELASASTGRDEAKKQVSAEETKQSAARRRMGGLAPQIEQVRIEVAELQTKLRARLRRCELLRLRRRGRTSALRPCAARGYEQLGELRKTLADLQDARDAARQKWQMATQERIAAQKVMLKEGRRSRAWRARYELGRPHRHDVSLDQGDE